MICNLSKKVFGVICHLETDLYKQEIKELHDEVTKVFSFINKGVIVYNIALLSTLASAAFYILSIFYASTTLAYVSASILTLHAITIIFTTLNLNFIQTKIFSFPLINYYLGFAGGIEKPFTFIKPCSMSALHDIRQLIDDNPQQNESSLKYYLQYTVDLFIKAAALLTLKAAANIYKNKICDFINKEKSIIFDFINLNIKIHNILTITGFAAAAFLLIGYYFFSLKLSLFTVSILALVQITTVGALALNKILTNYTVTKEIHDFFDSEENFQHLFGITKIKQAFFFLKELHPPLDNGVKLLEFLRTKLQV